MPETKDFAAETESKLMRLGLLVWQLCDEHPEGWLSICPGPLCVTLTTNTMQHADPNFRPPLVRIPKGPDGWSLDTLLEAVDKLFEQTHAG